MPAPEVRIRPGAAARFHAATASPSDHPALSKPLAAGEHQGAAAAAYPPAQAWRLRGALPAADVQALAGWLGGAILTAPDALGGTLRPEDIAVRPDGTPMLQPTGVQEKVHLAVPDPFNPPGDGSALEGALYGLGLILFEAATGTTPFSPKTRSDLERQQQNPPTPRSIRPDLPETLDTLIQQLLSPNPAIRRLAAPHLSAQSAPTVEVIAEEPTQAEPAAAGAETRPSPRQETRRDVPLGAWVVTANLSGIPTSLRRRLAALAKIPEAALDRAAAQELPVPVGSAGSEAEAQALAARLSVASVPLSVGPSRKRNRFLLLGGLGTVAVSLLGAVLGGAGLALAGLSAGFLFLLAAVTGAMLLVGGVAAAIGMFGGGEPAALKAGRRLLSAGYPALEPMAARMQDARRAVLTSELPEPARVDLLGALDGLQEALSDVNKAEERTQVSQAVEDIIRAATVSREHNAAAASIAEEASRRARAAQIAARELR